MTSEESFFRVRQENGGEISKWHFFIFQDKFSSVVLFDYLRDQTKEAEDGSKVFVVVILDLCKYENKYHISFRYDLDK